MLEDTEQKLAEGKTVTQKRLEVLRPDAQWLAGALEQLIQRRAAVGRGLLMTRSLTASRWGRHMDRRGFQSISSSDAAREALMSRVPTSVEEGTQALRKALLP